MKKKLENKPEGPYRTNALEKGKERPLLERIAYYIADIRKSIKDSQPDWYKKYGL